MKKIISAVFLLVIVGCGWWFWQDKTKLSEAKVLAHYEREKAAVLARKPEDLCALRAEDYTGKDIAESAATYSDKQSECKAAVEMFQLFDQLNKIKGYYLGLQHNYTINKITFSPDRKTATVDINYLLDLGEDFVHLKEHSTETLIIREGKTLLLKSEGETTSNFDE